MDQIQTPLLPVNAVGDEQDRVDRSPHRQRSSRRLEVLACSPLTARRKASMEHNGALLESKLTQRCGNDSGVPNFEARSQIFNFLSNRMSSRKSVAVDSQFLQEFEKLIAEQLARCPDDIDLLTVLKDNGWSCARFVSKAGGDFDPNRLSLALKNLYLRTNLQEQVKIKPNTARTTSSHGVVSQTLAALLHAYTSGSSANGGKFGRTEARLTCSFLPDILLSHICRQVDDGEELGVGSIAITGACMLVDISGFSKFSGELCSKGLTGLDDLHKATNGFLGRFVDAVYQYKGDGKSLLPCYYYAALII
jgi:hypothetical protein